MLSPIWINIYALRTECDAKRDALKAELDEFQSTHSIRSATPFYTFSF